MTTTTAIATADQRGPYLPDHGLSSHDVAWLEGRLGCILDLHSHDELGEWAAVQLIRVLDLRDVPAPVLTDPARLAMIEHLLSIRDDTVTRSFAIREWANGVLGELADSAGPRTKRRQALDAQSG